MVVKATVMVVSKDMATMEVMATVTILLATMAMVVDMNTVSITDLLLFA